MEINEYYELLSLNRALMEVRYLARDADDASKGSAHLTNIHTRVIEEIKKHLRASGDHDAAVGWEQWAEFSRREVERPLIIEDLARHWRDLHSYEQKREVLINQMRPFSFTEEDVQRMMQELDQRTSEE